MIVKVTPPFVWCLFWQFYMWVTISSIVLPCPDFADSAQVGGVGIQIVSLFWFYKIAQVKALPTMHVCLLCATYTLFKTLDLHTSRLSVLETSVKSSVHADCNQKGIKVGWQD